MIDAGIQSARAALGRGEWASVREQCRGLLQGSPGVAALHHLIGMSFCGEGTFGNAVPCFEAARNLEPDTADWTRDLAAVYATLDRWPDVLQVLTPHLAALDADALALFLTAAVEVGTSAAALAALSARPAPLPEEAQFLCAYGIALAMALRHAEAATALEQCVLRDAQCADAHEALAFVYEAACEPELALHHAEHYARLAPESAHATTRLALAYSERGCVEDARAVRRRALEQGLSKAEDHSANLFMMLSDPQETAQTILAASRRAFATAPAAISQEPSRRRIDARARLRVGYVTGECRSTPAYYFFRPFLPRHDRAAVEVFMYACNTLRDHVTASYQAWPEHWRECAGLPDAAVIETIRRDNLDVVVDLSGHFIFNRLGALCERVAPVQATYPNYPGTTGCPGMDYLFTDEWTSPQGTDHEYSETLVRLACGYLMYDPSPAAPPVGRLPLVEHGAPTFGIFQRLSKFNDGVWQAIALVLERVPRARLLIQNGDRELDRADSATTRMVRRQLESHGVDPARVTLKGPLPYADHLTAVTGVDIALDTFPYNGQTTTCESLWMGVPVVTRRQGTHVSRVCAALLTRVGHPEWVADSIEEYAGIAATLADDAASLSRLRHRLRDDVSARGLTNGTGLTRALEQSYHLLSN